MDEDEDFCECGEPECEQCADQCTGCNGDSQGGECDGGCCRPLCSGCNVGSIMQPRCEDCDEREAKEEGRKEIPATQGGGGSYDDGSLDGLADFLNEPSDDPMMVRAKELRAKLQPGGSLDPFR